jgi:hypothetical protein
VPAEAVLLAHRRIHFGGVSKPKPQMPGQSAAMLHVSPVCVYRLYLRLHHWRVQGLCNAVVFDSVFRRPRRTPATLTSVDCPKRIAGTCERGGVRKHSLGAVSTAPSICCTPNRVATPAPARQRATEPVFGRGKTCHPTIGSIGEQQKTRNLSCFLGTIGAGAVPCAPAHFERRAFAFVDGGAVDARFTAVC